jgi:hypothetical protein
MYELHHCSIEVGHAHTLDHTSAQSLLFEHEEVTSQRHVDLSQWQRGEVSLHLISIIQVAPRSTCSHPSLNRSGERKFSYLGGCCHWERVLQVLTTSRVQRELALLESNKEKIILKKSLPESLLLLRYNPCKLLSWDNSLVISPAFTSSPKQLWRNSDLRDYYYWDPSPPSY